MRKAVTPLILFAGAFLGVLLLQKYSFVYQEYDGLFLMSGDYFRSMFQTSFPISGIVGDFLTQFFRFGLYAPIIVGLGVALAFLMLRSLLSRLSIGWDVLSAVLSCGLWVCIAFAPTAKRGVAVLLVIFALWLVSRFLPKRETLPLKPWIDILASALIVAGVFVFLGRNESLRQRETTSALRVAVAQGDWNRVLVIANPEACAADRSMMPLAFMALGEKGQLGMRLFDYPITSQTDFDFSGLDDSYETLFFKAFLYERLNCRNEALHNFFQLATIQEHGLSFMVLRQMVADNYLLGNYYLVRKYADVLSRSTLHAQYARHFLGLIESAPPRTDDGVAFRQAVPLISHDPLYNLILLESNGISSPSTVDRILCTLLLQGDLMRFNALFRMVEDRYETVPRYYRDVLNAGVTPAR